MRPPVFRGFNLLPDELAVDNFAGGGGASVGIEAAIGRPVDMAINHDACAIAMHKANHPETRHFCENILEVDPVTACSGRPVGLAWFSPDCFPAGTMVLTSTGYCPIEQIAVGDIVLTHRQRWRRVTQTSEPSNRPLVEDQGARASRDQSQPGASILRATSADPAPWAHLRCCDLDIGLRARQGMVLVNADVGAAPSRRSSSSEAIEKGNRPSD